LWKAFLGNCLLGEAGFGKRRRQNFGRGFFFGFLFYPVVTGEASEYEVIFWLLLHITIIS
jgi:hypothetical protein